MAGIYEIIAKKRDGGVLTPQEISFFVKGVTDGSILDYQVSALLMAIFLRGLHKGEMVELTEAMLRSGETIDLSGIEGPKIDKHSTGGVGDKVSFIVAPWAAACGVKVPMLSGRSLGHAGGKCLHHPYPCGGRIRSIREVPLEKVCRALYRFQPPIPQCSGLHGSENGRR